MKSPLNLNRRELLSALGSTALVGQAGAQPAELPVSTRELWGWVRAQQILDPGITYLDTGSVGLGLRAALATEYRQQEQFNGDIDAYQKTFLTPSAIGAYMKQLASVLGCQADELTITQGATEALGLVAQGLTLSAGDEIIVTTHAHGSAIYPWLLLAERRGVVVKQVALPCPLMSADEPLGLIAGQVTEKTRVIAMSHIQYTDGAVLPVAEICRFARQREILTVVDGAQACGSISVSIVDIGCDFYAASLHKWLNGPHGLGALYVRRELLSSLAPVNVDGNIGWSVNNRFEQAAIDDEEQRAAWPATLAKFGCNVRFVGPQLKALQSTLDFREQLGVDRIEARIRELAIYARLRLQPLSDYEVLTPATPGMWAGILSIRPRKTSAQEVVQRMRRGNRIVASAIQHPTWSRDAEFSAVRVCLHIYNSHDDVERLVRALAV